MMEPQENPYRSPTTEVAGSSEPGGVTPFSAPPYKLYSIGSIMLAAFLGSIVAGGALMAINYVRLGRVSAAIHAVLWSTVILAVILGASVVLPEPMDMIPGPIVLGVQLVGMYYAAKGLQANAIEAHGKAGGRLASNWAAAGIALATVVLLLCVFAAVVTVVTLVVD